MPPKNWRIETGSFYIRRRDKLLVEVTGNAHMTVDYILKKTGSKFKVSVDGFRRGFRPATTEEKSNEVAAAVYADRAGG